MLSSASTPFEIEVSDELSALGFSKIIVKGKDMFVTYKQGNIICTFYKNDWEKTAKSIRKKFQSDNIDKNAISRFIVYLGREYIKLNSEVDQKASDIEKNTILEEIKKERAAAANVSHEEWVTKIVEKYENLRAVTVKNLPNLWSPLEFALSIKTILNIKDCTLPFAGIILGPPSSLKTAVIELFRKWPQTYYTDNFSAKAFVSHSSAVSKEELAKIDMLPRIKNKLFLTPELAPTFAAKDDDLLQVLGIMTRILDGHGYESDTGAHGHRGYNEEIMFTWVGAAVDIPRKVHKQLSTLGPKLYFFRLSKIEQTEEYYYSQINEDFGKKIEEIRACLFDYMKWFEAGPKMNVESTVPKMLWSPTNDEESACKYIIRLANLLARLRAVVPTWESRDTQGSEYAYSIPTIEDPSRAITQLRNLARGHALSQGRNYITSQDIPVVIQAVLSTASIERVTIFDLLISNKGKLTTSQITASLNTTNPTARRTMTELKALGLVETDRDAVNNSEKEIRLKSEFDWFLSEEFLALRYGREQYQLKEKYPRSGQNSGGSESREEYDHQSQLKEKLPVTIEKCQYNPKESDDLLKENLPLSSTNYNSGREQDKQMLKEKYPIRHVNNNDIINDSIIETLPCSDQTCENIGVRGEFSFSYNDKEQIFWTRYEPLEAKSGEKIVKGQELMDSLVSSNQFFTSDAHWIIEEMVNAGKLDLVDYDLYRRKFLN